MEESADMQMGRWRSVRPSAGAGIGGQAADTSYHNHRSARFRPNLGRKVSGERA
jgi:hypothetical protein